MDAAVAAALTTTVGFAIGDVLTALLARKVSGKASMLLLTMIKLVLYVPLVILWWHEFSYIDAQSMAWMVGLGFLFTAAYLGFNMAFQYGKDPALVGVVAGCFPASATVVAIVCMGQRPSFLTVALLISVLVGVVLIGLPRRWRTSFKLDKGILLALVPLIGWGTFGALIKEPINRLGTQHAWFVVQMVVVIVMVLSVGLIYNRHIPQIVRDTQRKKAWTLALVAGIILAAAEAFQAFALGRGQTIVIEALIGSYPAAYFLIAHKLFKQPLYARQWTGIVVVIVAIIALSTVGATA